MQYAVCLLYHHPRWVFLSAIWALFMIVTSWSEASRSNKPHIYPDVCHLYSVQLHAGKSFWKSSRRIQRAAKQTTWHFSLTFESRHFNDISSSRHQACPKNVPSEKNRKSLPLHLLSPCRLHPCYYPKLIAHVDTLWMNLPNAPNT